MPITIRRAEAADAAKCGAILYSAFLKVADEHNFPPDFPSVEAATDVVSMLLAHPGFYGIVAQDDDRIVGSNFADLRSSIAGSMAATRPSVAYASRSSSCLGLKTPSDGIRP